MFWVLPQFYRPMSTTPGQLPMDSNKLPSRISRSLLQLPLSTRRTFPHAWTVQTEPSAVLTGYHSVRKLPFADFRAMSGSRYSQWPCTNKACQASDDDSCRHHQIINATQYGINRSPAVERILLFHDEFYLFTAKLIWTIIIDPHSTHWYVGV